MGRFDNCTVWRNHYDFAKRLDTAADRAVFLMWIIEYQLNGTMPEDDGSVAFGAFKMIVPSLDHTMKQRSNGSMPKRNPDGSQTASQTASQTSSQTASQTEARADPNASPRARVSENEKWKKEKGKRKTETKGGAGGNGGGELLTGCEQQGGIHVSYSGFDSGDKSRHEKTQPEISRDNKKAAEWDEQHRRKDWNVATLRNGNWKDNFKFIPMDGPHTAMNPYHPPVDIALTIMGEQTDLSRNTMKKYLGRIGERRFRQEMEMFLSEVCAGEEVDNWAAALTARMKRLADNAMAKRNGEG